MKRSTYLRVIGVFELIGFGVGLIFYIVYWATEKLTALGDVMAIVLLFIILFFGPAVGILFLTVADTYDAAHEIANVIEKNEEKK